MRSGGLLRTRSEAGWEAGESNRAVNPVGPKGFTPANFCSGRAVSAGSIATTEQVDCVVIGAGVVGLATARALALSGREVLVLETEGAIGTGISSRNSEVIHAGIYYPTGTLKARLCVAGRKLLYQYIGQKGIEHRGGI